MPGFNALPNELLTIILDYVDIPDFENFAQINRHVKLVAQQRLEKHRLLSHQYATTNIRDYDLKSMYGLLKTFMTTNDGQYVRTIVFERSVVFDQRAQGIPSEDLDWLVQQVSNREIFTEALAQSDGANLMGKVRNHRRDILSALLLLCTPNVSHMTYPNDHDRSWWPDPWWPDPLWLQPIFCPADNSNSRTVLGKLTSLDMSGGGVDYPDYQDLIIRTPSLRKLRLDSLQVWNGTQRDDPCLITTLDLMPINVDPHYDIFSKPLHDFLGETKCLRTLTIKSWINDSVRRPEAPAMLTFANVLSPVSNTLRNLTVLYPKRGGPSSKISSLGSLVDFNTLEHFEAYFDGIFPEYLPLSLRAMRLHGKTCYTCRVNGKTRYSARIFIEALLEGHKSGANSRLKHLEFTARLASSNNRARNMLDEAIKQCGPFCIQLKAPDVIDNAIVRVKPTAV